MSLDVTRIGYPERRPVPPGSPDVAGRRELVAYVLLAYLLSTAAVVPLLIGSGVVKSGVGWPTHMPALFGPALAAFIVATIAGGRAGAAVLARGATRWRASALAWLVALSPFLTVAVVLAVELVAGVPTQPLAGFGRFSGMPPGLVWTSALLLAGALGEEIGWRGFALPRLQRRFGALRASLILALLWFGWHVPLFFVIASYREFPPAGYLGLLFGLACGSVILTWLFNHTGGSVLLCAVWHAGYNLASATTAADGAIAAVATTAVAVGAVILVIREVQARRAGRPSVLAPPHAPGIE